MPSDVKHRALSVWQQSAVGDEEAADVELLLEAERRDVLVDQSLADREREVSFGVGGEAERFHA